MFEFGNPFGFDIRIRDVTVNRKDDQEDVRVAI